MPQVDLNQDFIKNGLICPPGKRRIEFIPRDLPGMYVEVREKSPGQGTYFYRYNDASGKTCHQKIGRTSQISLADARKEAIRYKAEVNQGANPRAESKRQKEVPLLSAFFEDTYLPYAKARKRSWKRDEELYRLRIKGVFGNVRLNQLNRQRVQQFHTSLRDQEGLSPASADHHLKLLRSSLNLAVDWGLIDSNPITGVKQFNADNKVEHYLEGEDLQRLVDVLRSDENRMVCMICMFLLSTGCRLNEALQAEWKDVDRVTRTWRIQARNSKSKRMRSVPLNPSALMVLEQLGTEGDYEHVFVNLKTRRPYTTIMKAWSRLRLKAGVPHLRIHDLRHQFASLLVSSGRTLYEVQQILGHSDPKVTTRYAHLSSDALQAAANSASILVPSPLPAAA